LNHGGVLELLKLSSNVNEGKPLSSGGKVELLPTEYSASAEVKIGVDTFIGRCRSVPGRGVHSSTFWLNLSAFCGTEVHLGVV
jgi:hypothetical protein